MDNPLISIVIPVYNTAPYLSKCLDSVINQTYKNLEIIIGNNMSTDGSLDIINKYISIDSRIKLVNYKEFAPTVNESRCRCISEASADWIIPVDSDDYISYNYVAKLWTRHIETDADFVGSRMTLIDNEGCEYRTIPAEDFNMTQILSGDEAVMLTLDEWIISANGGLVRKDIWTNISSVLNSRPIETDEFESRILLSSCKMVTFADIPYYYNYNPNSVGRTPSWSKWKYNLSSNTSLVRFAKSKYGKSSQIYKSIRLRSFKYLIKVIEFVFFNIYKLKNKERVDAFNSVKLFIKEVL